MQTIYPLYPDRDTNTLRPQASQEQIFTTKSALYKVLGTQDPDTIISNNNGGYIINETSDYIPLSIIQDEEHTAIDSIVKLDHDTSCRIAQQLETQLKKAQQENNQIDIDDLTLHLLQQILDQELGIINDIGSAESEQIQAVASSDDGIIDSADLSQKMCTLRAGYMMKTLNSIGWKAHTIIGAIDGSGHARVVARSPSGENLMIDPMNPQTGQGYRFVNKETLSSSVYRTIKNGSYTGSLTMNNHYYTMRMTA